MGRFEEVFGLEAVKPLELSDEGVGASGCIVGDEC